MTYTVELSSAAAKSLKKLDPPDRRRIVGAIELLSVEPRPPGATMLRGGDRGRWCVRVGNHRVVYAIEDELLTVLVLRIAHRSEVYNR